MKKKERMKVREKEMHHTKGIMASTIGYSNLPLLNLL